MVFCTPDTYGHAQVKPMGGLLSSSTFFKMLNLSAIQLRVHAPLLITHTCCVQPPHFVTPLPTLGSVNRKPNHFSEAPLPDLSKFFIHSIIFCQCKDTFRFDNNKPHTDPAIAIKCSSIDVWDIGWRYGKAGPVDSLQFYLLFHFIDGIHPAVVGSNLDFIERKLLYSRPIWWGSATLLHLKYVIIIIKIIFWFMSSHMFCCWYCYANE